MIRGGRWYKETNWGKEARGREGRRGKKKREKGKEKIRGMVIENEKIRHFVDRKLDICNHLIKSY